MSDNNSELGAFLAGFVIGGLVGAATALILAPQSGEATRTLIADKSRELRQTGENHVLQYRDMADTVAHEYRDKAGQLVTEARTRIQDTGDLVHEQARIVLDTGKERAAQVRDQVSGLTKKDGDQSGESEGGEAAAAT
ncbi:MAG: YtxH domain-containing protein [Anaerolineae bacterium]